MKLLEDNDVQAVAAQATLDEVPRLFYMHCWANDDALKLARALRNAVDQTNLAKWMVADVVSFGECTVRVNVNRLRNNSGHGGVAC